MSLSKAKHEFLLFALICVLAVYRFSYLGFSYIPYLDDYIQYYFYPSLENNWQRIYAGGAGVLFTRPLAGLFDLCFWSMFGKNLGLAVAIISFLHGVSAVLFYKAANHCGVKVGLLFLVFYIFMPVNTEGTYWLSASSRIVVSMFLISLSVYCLTAKKTLLFVVFNFLSVWFYEQTAVLSVCCAAAACIATGQSKRLIFPAVSFVALVWFYLKLGGDGDNAQRMTVVSDFAVLEEALSAFRMFFKASFLVQLRIISLGFWRGFRRLALDFSLMWLGALVALIMGVLHFSQSMDISHKPNKRNIVFGIILVVVPLLPFVFLKNSFLNLRNIVPCSLGIALILDSFLSAFAKRFSHILAAILIFVFSVSAVSEVCDYQYTAKRDFELAVKIAKEVNEDASSVSVKINSPKYYPQNAPYGDHIMSITGSDWGVTGIVRTVSGNSKITVETKE
jgi:hypothetical protein